MWESLRFIQRNLSGMFMSICSLFLLFCKIFSQSFTWWKFEIKPIIITHITFSASCFSNKWEFPQLGGK